MTIFKNMLCLIAASHSPSFTWKREMDTDQNITNMSENPYRKPRFPTYPPLTQKDYTFFLPIPEEYQTPDPFQSKAQRKLLKQQRKEKQSMEVESSSQEYSDSESDSEPEPKRRLANESSSDSQSESQFKNNPLARARCLNPRTSRLPPRRNLNPFNRPKYPIPPCREPQYQRRVHREPQVKKQSEQSSEEDEDLAKWTLVSRYVCTAPFDPAMIYSSQITQMLTSQDFLNRHSLQEIRQRIDSLVIPNAPTRQQEINMQQARGDIVYISQAETWNLEQQALRLLAAYRGNNS